MPARNLLHKSKLDAFAHWCLIDNGIFIAPPSGDYQVLRVEIGGKMIPIYETIRSTEHYTVPDKLVPLVKKFINSQKKEAK